MKSPLFTRPAVVLLFSAAVALFALSALLHGYGDHPVAADKRNKTTPGTYSRSALGYAGFYDVLRRTGRVATRSVGNTLSAVGSQGTLVVAEPDPRHMSSSDEKRLLLAPRVLLVLPKWMGTPDKERPAWIKEAVPSTILDARVILSLVANQGNVVRSEWSSTWTTNELGLAPSPSAGDTVQLVQSKHLRPIVATEKGILLGEVIGSKRTVWVLADPDCMANHGIGKGDNALFMLALIDALRMLNNDNLDAPIVFDETVHGFSETHGSPLKLLFQFPFVVVTALLVLAGVFWGWAGVGRFGAPQTPKPELDFGKAGLIDNSARLFDYAGHHGVVLKRYALMTVRAAARALHAPPGLDAPALAVWLDRVGKARGVTKSCAAILQSVAAVNIDDPKNLPRLFECARDIHRWKGEILHGNATGRRRS